MFKVGFVLLLLMMPSLAAVQFDPINNIQSGANEKEIEYSLSFSQPVFIDGLNGFPGVYSAYVFYKIGCSGILKLMKDFKDKKRKACFRSVIVYKKPKNDPEIFIGESIGVISKKPLGKYGFGYDPIFIPDGEVKTFAQMETEEKNQFSHRGKSLNKLLDFFKNGRIENFKSL